ncbi:hypothetical protein CMK16_04235 [Candidatus Poribacteria bacterium]|nr:hypothetical protein [Candidatus Poribacteria bacterium]|tara:strand:- start:311 stop:649 length:339 start_codon:yes stop_codon:yes gene_type:complete
MFYHPTKCPRCNHSNVFGKIRCGKCLKAFYTENLKPLRGFDALASSRSHQGYRAENKPHWIFKTTYIKVNPLSQMGTFGLDVIIAIINETQRVIKDLIYAIRVIFKLPPDER